MGMGVVLKEGGLILRQGRRGFKDLSKDAKGIGKVRGEHGARGISP
jgi:hypothetical protein